MWGYLGYSHATHANDFFTAVAKEPWGGAGTALEQTLHQSKRSALLPPPTKVHASSPHPVQPSAKLAPPEVQAMTF